ncbi:MAG: Neu5Ac permease [Pseudomonadota bacterium]|jgi:tripartite ATP-independent transporter DctM subunit
MSALLPVAMAVLTLAGILLGYRVALVLAGSSALFILVSELPLSFFGLIVSRIYSNVIANWLLVAIPMFIFMGLMLERAGVAERALRAAQNALGGSPAGMGLSVLVIGVLLAVSSGIVGASVVLLAMLALPRLLENGYSKETSAGLVAASGTLAILIPPSVMLIVLADQLRISVGDLFAAAFIPGLILVALYAIHVLYTSRRLKPGTIHSQAHGRSSFIVLVRDLLPLLLLVVCVLGSIVSGLATPTEASGLGALGSIAIALLYGQCSWARVMGAARETVVATSMVLLVMIGATCFAAVFNGIGGNAAIEHAFKGITGGPWILLTVVMIVIFLLGFVLDWLEITMILMPIFGPIVATMDFGNGLSGSSVLVWFAVLVAVNLQTSFLTPPFGFALFYLRGAAPETLSTQQIYRGVIPFVVLQLIGLGILVAFPVLVVGVL